MDKRASAIIVLIGLVLLSPAFLVLVGALTNDFAWLQVIFFVFAIVLPLVGIGVVVWGIWGLVRED